MIVVNSKRELLMTGADRNIGFVDDNKVETRVFEISDPKLFGFNFVLDTINENGEKNITTFDEIEIVNDKLRLTLIIRDDYLQVVGRLQIQLRAFEGAEDIEDIPKWHSGWNHFNVGDSINAKNAFTSPLPTEFEQIESIVTQAKIDAEQSAEDATFQANRAKDIADGMAVDINALASKVLALETYIDGLKTGVVLLAKKSE